jgi:hypothetical protein
MVSEPLVKGLLLHIAHTGTYMEKKRYVWRSCCNTFKITINLRKLLCPLSLSDCTFNAI